MTATLGQIDKPSAERFQGRRKLYLVPLIYSSKEVAAEQAGMFERYWQQAQEHVHSLSSRLGKVARVYHEAVALAGEEGMKMVETLSPQSFTLVQDACSQGASLEALEDPDWLTEAMDWERCLLVGLLSPRVVQLVSSQYQEAIQKRYEALAERIDSSLRPEEAGLLLISENHRIQFPQDIQVFYVAPPTLDEIHRWMRDRTQRETQANPPTE